MGTATSTDIQNGTIIKLSSPPFPPNTYRLDLTAKYNATVDIVATSVTDARNQLLAMAPMEV